VRSTHARACDLVAARPQGSRTLKSSEFPRNHELGVGLVVDAAAVVRRHRGSGFAKLVHGYWRLALAQTDDVLCLHVDLSVPRITRHFFPDPTGEVEFLIRVLQFNLCKHYTI